MNANHAQKIIQYENMILDLQYKLMTTDGNQEVERDLKMEIIKLNGKVLDEKAKEWRME